MNPELSFEPLKAPRIRFIVPLVRIITKRVDKDDKLNVWGLLEYDSGGERHGSGSEAKNTFLSQKYKYDSIERKAADMLWNWPLLDDVDKIGMEGCKDDVSRLLCA